ELVRELVQLGRVPTETELILEHTQQGEIVSDNGKQFSDNPFKDWCDKLNITQRFASVKHPQFSGLIDRVNRSVGEGIKSRLVTAGKLGPKWEGTYEVTEALGDKAYKLRSMDGTILPRT
nr:reverse transcriptase domain-containing protein [Tanacetum cinerariifolium]